MADISTSVTARLKELGYTVTDDDTAMITYITNQVEQEIKNRCNITAIPDALQYVEVDMICGELLDLKNSSGALASVFDMAAAEKSISEGDTSVTYSDEDSLATKIGKIIVWLKTHGIDGLIEFRRVRW